VEAKKRAIKDEAHDAWYSGASAEEWTTRYEAVRRQGIQGQHSGWELALLVRRGVMAWMRAWPTVEESSKTRLHFNSPANGSPAAEIVLPDSLCEQVTSVLVNMILPRRSLRLEPAC
jgi:hypothetical protein